MRILKNVIIVVAVILAIPLILALFVRNTYSVEREIIINKPEEQVFNYIKLLKNQDNYSKWATMDPQMKQEYSGTDGKAGFVSSWDSQKREVGKGEQTIMKITEGERIDFELHFIKPFEGRAGAYMATEPVSADQTKVVWGFTGRMKYPMNAMLLFMNMEDMIGKDLEEGLVNLKNVLE